MAAPSSSFARAAAWITASPISRGTTGALVGLDVDDDDADGQPSPQAARNLVDLPQVRECVVDDPALVTAWGDVGRRRRRWRQQARGEARLPLLLATCAAELLDFVAEMRDCGWLVSRELRGYRAWLRLTVQKGAGHTDLVEEPAECELAGRLFRQRARDDLHRGEGVRRIFNRYTELASPLGFCIGAPAESLGSRGQSALREG